MTDAGDANLRVFFQPAASQEIHKYVGANGTLPSVSCGL